jgi:GT2 family glycosyltransferase
MIPISDPDISAMAVVVTDDAPASLERCLLAIAAQTTPPQAVLVVDNASTPPVVPADFPPGCPPVTLVRCDHNGGPAGSFALALGHFLASPYRHAWVIEDDMRPDPDCLERLWVVGARDPARTFVFPVIHQADGTFGAWPTWCGLLVSREIVEEVGLPMSELFSCGEDTEYLQWRIPQAGYPIRVVGDAHVRHDAVRRSKGVPVWQYYYEARNLLYLHLQVKKRVGHLPRDITRLFLRALVSEPEGRGTRAAAVIRGLNDGARGRLGSRFPVDAVPELSEA